MGRTNFKGPSGKNGPVSGAYLSTTQVILAFAVSQTDGLAFWWTAGMDARIQRITIANSGQAITGYKIRRKTPASGTAVAVGDTQMLGADGGAVSANTSTVIDVTGTSATLLLEAQRNILQGDQIGVFISNGAVTPNIQVTIIATVTGHANASPSND